jgi:hypothetical protein
MDRGSTRRWVVSGLAATLLSVAVQQAVLALRPDVSLATAIRLGTVLPLLYLAHSRWVLRTLFAAERAAFGPVRAEQRMLVRVVASLAASTLAKVVLEPLVAPALFASLGPPGAGAAALFGDLVYGPLANYLALTVLSRRPALGVEPPLRLAA